MAEYQTEPLYKPPLRPHRLIPARPEALPAEGQPAVVIERQMESWLAVSSEVPLPALADAGQALAGQAWLFIEKAALTLDRLPPVFQAVDASEEILEALELISSLLLALPDLMASGLENNIARVDWMFSRLLNAPGHPGLVELVIETLAVLEASDAPDAPLADLQAASEVLRGLHRDLVTLQQRWDVLIEDVFPVVFLPPPGPLPVSEGQAVPARSPAAALPSHPAPKQPAPLPAGLLVAPTALGRQMTRPFRRPFPGKHPQRLALLVALVLVVIIVLGMLLVHTWSTPATNAGSAALSLDQRTPVQSTVGQPTPTQTVRTPAPSPTIPATPTPTPRPPTPTPGASICPNGAAFCVSALQLQVPCAGAGSSTLQLMNASRNNEGWQAVLAFGGTLVTITPAHGSLNQGQTVTLSLQANTQQEDRSATLMILGPVGTAPISVAVQVCG